MFTQSLLLNYILFAYVNGKDMTEISINDLREPEQELVYWIGHLLANISPFIDVTMPTVPSISGVVLII